MTDANTIDAIEKAALELKPDARAKLAQRLVESLAALPESELAELWLREAERRDQELDSGNTAALPGISVIADIRSRYDK
ncbi:addiction module protein [Marinihelvus fidelis]|uniref:Addiction module protein n=1 Tax=Marinihelvus fidelis TaxID=2613842 RepID=A0A5N0TCU7_9GAMM|nr:addiction module protein [Marinihelvus fidelis]KAA9132790.1 addiction module protein [Marinihelvus fidelis]